MMHASRCISLYFFTLLAPLSGAVATTAPELEPWHHAVLIRTTDEFARPICSGVLVDPHTVLTAKHCFNSLVGLNFMLEFEVEGRITTTSTRPRSVVLYPGDQRLFPMQDLALVHFDGVLPEGVVPAIPMPLELSPSKGTPLLAFGFGRDGRAHHAGLRFDQQLNGERIHGVFTAITPADEGPCFGDSGGGVYALVGTRWRLLGIVAGSWDVLANAKRGCKDNVMVVSDTRYYINWITSEKIKDTNDKNINHHARISFLDVCRDPSVSTESWITTQGIIANAATAHGQENLLASPTAAAEAFTSCTVADRWLTAMLAAKGSIVLRSVQDISPLATLKGVRSLDFLDAMVDNWHPLTSLASLKTLKITGNQGSIPANILLSLTHLQALSLSYVTISGSKSEIAILKKKRGINLHQVSWQLVQTQ